jgi:peptidase E
MLHPSKLIYLVGGDEFSSRTEAADHEVLKACSNRTVAVIPTAAADRGPGQAATNGVKYFSRMGADAEAIMILSPEDAKSYDSGSLGKFGLFFFTGGSPEQLVSILRFSSAFDSMRSAWLNGSVIGGSSAGAMALGSTFRCPRHGWFDGFGMADLICVPHAEGVDDAVRREVFERAGSRPVVYLPSQAACFVEASRISCVGTEAIEVSYSRGTLSVRPNESISFDSPLIL